MLRRARAKLAKAALARVGRSRKREPTFTPAL